MRFLPIVLLLPALGVHAHRASYCDGNTREIELCFAAEQEKAEVELNQVYSRAMKRLSQPDSPFIPYATTKRQLIAAQRAWVAFRKADCEAWGTYNVGGTARGIEYVACMLSHTDRRIEDLRQYADR
jgi:uncharacterized protein YecT (DUF1311 family)